VDGDQGIMADRRRDETTAPDVGQAIRSPEQVELHLPIAGPTTRILAYAIDAALILACEVLGLVLYGLAMPGLLRRLAALGGTKAASGTPQLPLFLWAALVIMMATVELAYFLFWDLAAHGRSPGKMALGLRVVTEEGFPLDARRSLVRNLLRAADMLPFSYVVGLVAMVASRRTQRLGDLAAGTLVVRLDRPPPALPLDEEPAPADAAFRLAPAQLACLGRAELALVRETLRRLDDLPAGQAEQVLARSVEALRARLDYGPVAPAERVAFLRALLHAARLR
jgi:uncharacterized RDD family membrane protein YckC